MTGQSDAEGGPHEPPSARLSGRVESADAFGQRTHRFEAELGDDSLAGLEGRTMKATYLTEARLQALAEQLTPIDWAVLQTLARVRLASGQQLERLHFAGRPRQARRTLSRLATWHLAVRLDRRVGGVRAGSHGYIYALARGGQRLLAARAATHAQRPPRTWTPGRPFLSHSLLVSETYVRLVEVERAGGLRLLMWTSEPTCWRSFTGRGGTRLMLKPDAFVRVGLDSFEDAWFLEVDCATESSTALARKFDLYRQYWTSGQEQARLGVFPRVLWLVPSEARQEQLVEVASRQPAEAWKLFTVRRYEELIQAVREGAA